MTTLNFQPATLEDDLVTIKPLKETDFERLYQVGSDPLIWEQHPSSDRYKRAVFQEYFDGAIASGTAFLVFDKLTGELIGSTRFYDFNSELSSIAIGFTFLARKYWGGTYNKAMKKLLIDYAFGFVDAVVFHVGAHNIRSQKAVLKIGGEKTGEQEIVQNGNARNTFVYEIKKNNWKI